MSTYDQIIIDDVLAVAYDDPRDQRLIDLCKAACDGDVEALAAVKAADRRERQMRRRCMEIIRRRGADYGDMIGLDD